MIAAAAAEWRLRRRAEFERVLQQPRRAASRNFTLWAQTNACGVPRLGIVAGRKAAPRAVDRNRGKRLIREMFGAAARQIAPLDVVVQLRTDLRHVNNRAVRDELRQLLEKLPKVRDTAAG